MYLKIILMLIFFHVSGNLFGQQPRYTEKHFVKAPDTTEFKYILPGKNGFARSYLPAGVTYYDLDDDSTTYMKFSDSVLLCIEGTVINKKREGVFKFSLIDKFNHSKRYLIYEQMFKNDKLNGLWKTYTLRGGLFNFKTFEDDNVDGISKTYWIDGKTITEEINYFGNELSYSYKNYYDNKNIKTESTFLNNKLEGISKSYYQNGKIQELAEFKNGEFDGHRKYFYENGQLWIDQIYKNGKSWEVIANYTADGKKRDAGTLANGKGTVIYYNDDGSIRETETYIKGILQNN